MATNGSKTRHKLAYSGKVQQWFEPAQFASREKHALVWFLRLIMQHADFKCVNIQIYSVNIFEFGLILA